MIRLANLTALASAVAALLSSGQLSAREIKETPKDEVMPLNLATITNHSSFGNSLGYSTDYRRRFSLESLGLPSLYGEWTFASVGYTIQPLNGGDLVTLSIGSRIGVAHRPVDWLELFTNLGPEGYLFIYYPTALEKLNFYTMKSWGLRCELGSRLVIGSFFGGIGHSVHWPIGGEPGPVDFFLKINWPDSILEIDRERLEQDTFESKFGQIKRDDGHPHSQTIMYFGFYWRL